jgi:hypothetical protein
VVLWTAGRAIARCWPLLLTFFLAGWLGHEALIRLAGWAGNYQALWGLLILPLAVLVKLAGYVGMFLAVGPALRHYERLETVARDAAASAQTVPLRRSFAGRWAGTVLTGLIPFLVIYMAWGMIGDDLLAYGRASVDQFGAEGATDRPYSVTIGVMSVTFVIVTFGLRFVLGRFAARLPSWVGVLSAYLEAAWLITAAIALGQLLAGVPQWLASRRMFAWFVDAVAQLRADVAWFAWAGDAFTWTLGAVGDVLLQPLAWLALAAIVYAGALPRRARRTGGRAARLAAAAERRWRRMPRPVRRLGTSLSSGFRERWEPIATALSLVWRNGPVQLAAYILSFAVVVAGTQWLYRGIYTLIGPREYGWWRAINDPIVLLVSAVSVTLQIAVVAAAFDTSLARLDEQVSDADAELAEVLPER